MIVRGGIISMAVVTGRRDPYGSFLSLVPFRLVAPPLELEVGGGISGMGYMILQPFVDGGNWSYPDF
jgi:hypothetical protein